MLILDTFFFLANHRIMRVQWPLPYQDLGPCDFFNSPKIKIDLMYKIWKIRNWNKYDGTFSYYIRQDFQKCSEQWKTRWNMCIEYQWDSFIVQFSLGKYSFSLDTFWTHLVQTSLLIMTFKNVVWLFQW